MDLMSRLIVLLLILKIEFAQMIEFNKRQRLMRSPSNFSSHRCVGGHNYDNVESAMRRKCVLYNVCHFEGEGDALHYFVDKNRPQMPSYADHNNYIYDFGSVFVSAGVFQRFSDRWAPKVDPNPFPEHFPWDEAGRAVFIQTFNEDNPGHFSDTLNAIYSIPMMLGYHESTDIKVLDAASNTPFQKHRDGLMSGLSKHTPEYLSKTGNRCFSQVFVGAGYLSMLEGSEFSGQSIKHMRNFLLRNLNDVHPNLLATQLPGMHHIVILRKYSKSSNNFNHIRNHDELVEYLQRQLSHVAQVTSLLPDPLSWADQLRIIQSATIIITPPGGGAFLSLYAREGCGLIILDKNYQGRSVREVSLVGSDDNLWTFASSMYSFFNYPVCSTNENDGDIVAVPKRMLAVIIMTMFSVEDQVLGSQVVSPFSAQTIWNEFKGNVSSNAVDICAIK